MRSNRAFSGENLRETPDPTSLLANGRPRLHDRIKRHPKLHLAKTGCAKQVRIEDGGVAVLVRAAPLGALMFQPNGTPGLRDGRFTPVASPWAGLGPCLRHWRRMKIFLETRHLVGARRSLLAVRPQPRPSPPIEHWGPLGGCVHPTSRDQAQESGGWGTDGSKQHVGGKHTESPGCNPQSTLGLSIETDRGS